MERVQYDEFGMFARERRASSASPTTARRSCGATSRRARRRPPAERAGVGRRAARARVPPRRRPERPHVGHRRPGPRPSARRHRPARPRALRRRAQRARSTSRSERRRRGRGRSARSRPTRGAVVGMSLGGLTTLAAGAPRARAGAGDRARRRHARRHAPRRRRPSSAFVNGPASFDSFDELLARTIEYNPTRTESSLRRGILHNAAAARGRVVGVALRALPARRGRGRPARAPTSGGAVGRVVDELTVPVMLVRGMRPQSVVDDADEAELLRRCPHARGRATSTRPATASRATRPSSWRG